MSQTVWRATQQVAVLALRAISLLTATPKRLPPTTTMIELKLPTMTCGHCVRAVTQAVHSLDPQAQVDIDLPGHQVRIHTLAAPATVRAALVEAGYTPDDGA